MTDSNHKPADRPAGVLDSGWEDELRRGQEAEGEAGSVEDELAYLHLLRHAREPERLGDGDLDAIWSAIDADITPARVPWWRKAWVWWSAPALAAAAVLVVVVVRPGADEAGTVAVQDQARDAAKDEQLAAPAPAASEPLRERAPEAELAEGAAASAEAEAEVEDAQAQATGGIGRGGGGVAGSSAGQSPFEASFARLAPHGRLAIRASVDTSRDELRSQLLAKARGGG